MGMSSHWKLILQNIALACDCLKWVTYGKIKLGNQRKNVEITFYVYQQNKSSESKAKFRQVSNFYKKFLEAGKLAYANKTEESI